MIFTLVWAAINLIWNLPIVLNVVLDTCLLYTIVWSCTTRVFATSWPNKKQWCQLSSGPVCDTKFLILEILLCLVAGLALATA